MKARFAAKTDVGRERDHNEDAFLMMPEFAVIAVADGLGGHRSGHIASSLCVATLSDFFIVTVHRDATWPFPYDDRLTDEENYLSTGIRLANRRIFDRSLKAMSDFGMGTTCVTAMFSRDRTSVSVAHVGDSRCYRLRAGTLTQLTRDHSLVSDAKYATPDISEEELAQMPPNVITRALGIREDVLVDLHHEATETGDIYLLCSDGLSGLVKDEDIIEVLTGTDDLEAAADELVARANANGGIDNITVAIAKLDPGSDTHDEDTIPDTRPAASLSKRSRNESKSPSSEAMSSPVASAPVSSEAPSTERDDKAPTED